MNVITLSILAVAAAFLVFSVPAHAAKLDSRIELSARQSYVFKTYLKDDEIKISSKNGAVILTGLVADSVHKSLAQETVASLPGVKCVDNRLEVKGSRPSINSDEWLLEKVKVTLLFHRSVSSKTTEIFVKDGIVTLRGDVISQAQKELTAEYVKDVDGVKDVVNDLIVTQIPEPDRTVGEKIDDASITAQIKMTLLYHRSTSALNTKVETKRGVVTLHGKAQSISEKDFASRFANDIDGVKNVKNFMTIE
ncbi:MAG: BON domain-containing protein [Desulfuromonadaceae bacterium]|nr:BON domain-containing protein [Desulfuromonadaceae bacterium]